MAAPATKPPALPTTKPVTALEQLHADRAEVAGELATLNASSARLSAAANAEAAVVQEIADMATADTAAMTAWATGGCIGEAPRSDQNQRIKLGQKLNTAQASAAAAKGAGHDIAAQIAGLNDQLRSIGAQIEKAALDTLQTDFRDLNGEHFAAVEVIRKLTAKMHGLCSFLSNEGRRRIDSGDLDGGKQYLARAEALTSIKLASPGVTQGEIIEAANDWSRRAATLRSGS
jgi:hypothetical protein